MSFITMPKGSEGSAQKYVWDDCQVQIGDVAGGGWFGAAFCDQVEYRSGVALEFENSTSSGYKVLFNAQITHRYAVGEDIEFHLHVGNEGAGSGNSVFKLTYQWAGLGATYGSDVTKQATVPVDGTDGKHQFALISSELTGSAPNGISSILLCTLERVADDGSDTFGESVYIIGLDFHIPVDSGGSKERTVK